MDTANISIQQIFFLRSSLDHCFYKGMYQRFELPKGLNFTHMRTMMILKDLQECSMSRLSSILLLEKGSFTPVANLLIAKGLMVKEQSSKDKRKYILSLSPEGSKLAQQFGTIHKDYIEEQMSKLSNEERREYLETVARLFELHQKMEAMP